MNCDDLTSRLDDYIDGALDASDTQALQQHVAGCDGCRLRVGQAKELRSLMQQYGESSMPQPSDGFFDRALLRAAHNGSRRQRNRWVMTGFSGAIAAGLAIWFIGGMFMKTPTVPESSIPEISMALEEPRTINLVFSSAAELVDATLTVSLPPGIEMQGFHGQSEVTWLTSLSAGKNVLPLKLIATMPQGGELLATLRHEDDDRTFRLQVKII